MKGVNSALPELERLILVYVFPVHVETRSCPEHRYIHLLLLSDTKTQSSAMDNFPPEEIAYQTAHIEDNRSVLITVVASVFTGVALLSLFIRIISRTVTRAKLGADDYLSIGATVALIGVFVTVCYGMWSVVFLHSPINRWIAAHFGIGRHLIFVAQNPQNFIEIGKVCLQDPLKRFYIPCLGTDDYYEGNTSHVSLLSIQHGSWQAFSSDALRPYFHSQ